MPGWGWDPSWAGVLGSAWLGLGMAGALDWSLHRAEASSGAWLQLGPSEVPGWGWDPSRAGARMGLGSSVVLGMELQVALGWG